MPNRYSPTPSPQTQAPKVESNFTQGLKTEYTGLNFPENACVATSNCTFTRVGNVTRRNGFDYELNFSLFAGLDRTNLAFSSFLWENAGGDGNTVLQVQQVGAVLYFYLSTTATTTNSLSHTLLPSTVLMTNFGAVDTTKECQFASGNGYLFVFHPSIDPLYCTYNASNATITPNSITVSIRDLVGIPEMGVADNYRPGTLSAEHQYNLQNQGWTQGSVWIATSTSNVAVSTSRMGQSALVWSIPIGSVSFTVASGIVGISNGQSIVITGVLQGPSPSTIYAAGLVTSYSGTTLVLNITSSTFSNPNSFLTSQSYTITPNNIGYINTWFSALANYPSNADQWWQFKTSVTTTSGSTATLAETFSPATTINTVTLDQGPAPKGFYILPAFVQQRSVASSVGGLTDIVISKRPKTGAWYQGRVWYSGVDASNQATGDEPFTTWTENVYFSQIALNPNQFGRCYQTNDPTSETLFNILPSDGGVISIQGSGSIYKLFPVLNGLLVFAANGIWFITGDQGLGFSATDFNVTKISGEHCISGSSFVNVIGYPMFWNADGIYMVMPGQSYTSGQKSLEVKDLTLPSIRQFYQSIPLSSKKLARGAYNHITGVVQWLYKSTEAVSILDAYSFDSILNFLTYTEAFYPWSLPNVGGTSNPYIHTISYIEGPGGLNVPPPIFKYFTSSIVNGVYNYTFSEERNNTTYTDWLSYGTPINFVSSFQTGYKLHGEGQRKWQPQYVYVYSEIPSYGYKINGVWNYAISSATGKYSTVQLVKNNVSNTRYSKWIKRHRVRGSGYVFQLNIQSVDGQPFNISGWSMFETQNMMA